MEVNPRSMNSFHGMPNRNSLGGKSLLSVEEAEEKIQRMIQENTDLRNTLQQNNTYMRQLSCTLIEWQEEVIRVQNVYENKLQKAKEIISKLRAENASLKQRVNTETSITHPPTDVPVSVQSDPNGQNQEVIESSLDSYVLVPETARDEAAKPTPATDEHNHPLPSYDSLFQGKDKSASSIDPYVSLAQQESDFLRAQLASEMESNKNKQLLLNKTQDQLDRLMIEYQELSKKWGKLNQSVTEDRTNDKLEDLTKINHQLKKACSELETQVISANNRLAIAEEMVLSKQVDITDLQSEVARLEKCLETLPILKAQMELFRSDFEAERDARQSLAGEKDSLQQEIRLLKRQLEGGVESTYVAPTNNSEDAGTATYECPKCSFKFLNNEALNNHLDVCLNEAMFP